MGEHKNKPQDHEVAISNLERFALAEVMLAAPIKSRKEARAWSRVFEELELDEYEGDEKRSKAPKDGQRTFHLSLETLDYIPDLYEKIQMNGRGVRNIGPVVDRFEQVRAGTYELPAEFQAETPPA